VSGGATLFVALVGSTQILTAVLGDEPKLLIGQILIASALATFLIGAAPMILKAFGKTEEVTVRGLFLGAFVTITGASFQVLSISWAVSEAVKTENPFWILVLAVGFLSAWFLWFYGSRTLRHRLEASFSVKKPVPEPVSTELIAAVYAANSDVDFTSIVKMAREIADEAEKQSEESLKTADEAEKQSENSLKAAVKKAHGNMKDEEAEQYARIIVQQWSSYPRTGYSRTGTSPGDETRSGVL
jgi:hypothetical protein